MSPETPASQSETHHPPEALGGMRLSVTPRPHCSLEMSKPEIVKRMNETAILVNPPLRRPKAEAASLRPCNCLRLLCHFGSVAVDIVRGNPPLAPRAITASHSITFTLSQATVGT